MTFLSPLPSWFRKLPNNTKLYVFWRTSTAKANFSCPPLELNTVMTYLGELTQLNRSTQSRHSRVNINTFLKTCPRRHCRHCLGPVHTNPFSNENGALFLRFQKICVHADRFRIVFARPHYNADQDGCHMVASVRHFGYSRSSGLAPGRVYFDDVTAFR